MSTPPVAIIGDSGTGKSTLIETLPPEKTVILNTENKPLPMRNFNSFTNINITAYKKFEAILTELARTKLKDGEEILPKDKYDYVVIDSFTSLTEMIHRYSSAINTGYDIWAGYNDMIVDMLLKIKALPQQVFVIALPEQKAEQFGEVKEYARVKGKELKYGFFEKEFAVVLFTSPQYDDDSGEMEDVLMDFKPNKRNSAKAPRGLFKERPKNDALVIATAINEYYGNN